MFINGNEYVSMKNYDAEYKDQLGVYENIKILSNNLRYYNIFFYLRNMRFIK